VAVPPIEGQHFIHQPTLRGSSPQEATDCIYFYHTYRTLATGNRAFNKRYSSCILISEKKVVGILCHLQTVQTVQPGLPAGSAD
jgi:hypothetical protein